MILSARKATKLEFSFRSTRHILTVLAIAGEVELAGQGDDCRSRSWPRNCKDQPCRAWPWKGPQFHCRTR